MSDYNCTRNDVKIGLRHLLLLTRFVRSSNIKIYAKLQCELVFFAIVVGKKIAFILKFYVLFIRQPYLLHSLKALE